MRDISKTRKLSLIGSLLLLIPGLNIVGLILIVISLKDLAEYYNDTRIYREIITDAGTIIGIIGLIALSISIFFFSLLLFHNIPSDSLDGYMERSWPVAAAALPMAIIALTCISVTALFFRKSFYTLSSRSGVQLFRTTGNLLLISTVVPIVYTSLVFALENVNGRIHYASQELQALMQILGPLMMLALIAGLILVHIAFILLAISFFSLKPAPSKCNNN